MLRKRMPVCDICKQTAIQGDVLCGDCRESINRLAMICQGQPALLRSATAGQPLELEAGAAAAA